MEFDPLRLRVSRSSLRTGLDIAVTADERYANDALATSGLPRGR